MKDFNNFKQKKWVLERALRVLETYGNRELTEAEIEKMTEVVQKFVTQSKDDKFCTETMLSVVEAIALDLKG